MLIGGLAERGARRANAPRMQGDSTPHPETGRRRSASISTSSATGSPTTLKKSPSIPVTSAAPDSWIAYAAGAAAATRRAPRRRRSPGRRAAGSARRCARGAVRSPALVAQRQAGDDLVRRARRAARACGAASAASAGLPSTCVVRPRTTVSTPSTVSPSPGLDRERLAAAVALGQLVRRARAAAPLVATARRCGSRGRAG